MSKPIVFLSHSSVDEKPLGILKNLLFKKTGGAITLFLSSDGQSIPLGRNWVHELQQALNESQLMFVFVSPNSLRSSWIHFEVGYAYSKGVRVVPVGIGGLDLANVAPPLSLLQGFNVTSGAGLNNLIVIINQVFNHAHEESFTRHDFEAAFAHDASGSTSMSARPIAKLVSNIRITVAEVGGKGLDMVEECLKRKGVEYNRSDKVITTYGMRMYLSGSYLVLKISCELAKANLPVVSEFIAELRGGVGEKISSYIELVPEVSVCQGHHNITARLFGTKVKLGPLDALQYEDVNFSVDNDGEIDNARVTIGCSIGQLQSLDIEGLLDILVTQQVLLLEA